MRGKQRLAAAAWLIALLAMMAWSASHLSSGRNVDTSILALLPAGGENPVTEKAAQALSDEIASRAVLMLGGSLDDRQKLQAQAVQFRRALEQSGAFESVRLGPDPGLLEVLRADYRPYRYQLLTVQDRRDLTDEDHAALIRRAVRELINPANAGRAASLVEDPLNLLGHWLASSAPGAGFSQDSKGFYAEQGDRHYRVVLVRFIGAPFDAATQEQVLAAVSAARAGLPPSTSVHRSGLVFHAAAGAEQARRELSTIGLGSLSAVVLLLLWHFRSGWSLILPVVSVGAGLCVAATASLLIFGRLHVVTLAFGASLVGVSVDYAMHYLCARQAMARLPLRHILPGITLGLLSSVLAYGAQWFTPFPGLRQIAVFSAFGLIGAWLTVVFWFPLTGLRGLRRPQGVTGRPLGRGLEWLGQRSRWPSAGVLALVSVAAVAGWFQVEFRDNLGDLQSSPQALLESEQLVQQASGGSGSGRFLVVTGDSGQQVLQREETLRPTLEALVSEGRLGSFQAMSQWIPSRARQQSDYAHVRQALQQTNLLDRLGADLGLPTTFPDRSRELLSTHEPEWLAPGVTAADMPGAGKYLSYLWLGEQSLKGQGAASVIALGAVSSPDVYQELKALAENHDGVRFVDRVSDISGLLATYRQQVGLWLAVAYGLVGLLLLARYRRHSLRVLLPPLVATGLTFGLLALAGQPLTLFNQLATLLILGIGLDMGIFLRESDGQTHAWEAITLSAVTSVLAFGLLALSGTPVLHHFGVTVLPGLVLCWLIALVVSPPGTGAGFGKARDEVPDV